MKVIRVGVMNNFDFTDAEIEALKKYESKGKIFVNSNSFTKVRSDYPSFLTINPYLLFFEPKGDLSNVKACRIKFIAGANAKTCNEEQKAIKFCIANNLPILITWQRFYKRESLETYVTKENLNMFSWNSGYFRPTEEAKAKVRAWIDSFDYDKVHECDKNSSGCLDCNNCVRLTFGEEAVATHEICGLNLSCSGVNGSCSWSCKDCFAKRLLMGKAPLCDKIFKNRKQRGVLEHK